MGKVLDVLNNNEMKEYIISGNNYLVNSEEDNNIRESLKEGFIVYKIDDKSLKLYYNPIIISPYNLQLGIFCDVLIISYNSYDFLVRDKIFKRYTNIDVINADLENNEIYFSLVWKNYLSFQFF